MIDKLRQKLGNQVKENEILANHTTFRIGGPARYFYLAKNSQDLLEAIKTAEKLKITYFILGWGSNVLVADSGFDGLIIKAISDQFEIRGEEVFVEAGFSLNRLIGITARAGLAGLEPFTGIPATVGGAARGNAGAFGIGFGDLVKEVEIYKDNKVKKFSQQEMKYAYRHSILKNEAGIILSVVIKLKKANPQEIWRKIVEIAKERKEKLPAEPSAGCIFKNIELNKIKIDENRIIKELDITKQEWQQATKHGKLPIGYIIDRLDLKGKTIGSAQISQKHGAIIINTGQAKAEQVMMLISDIKMRIRNQLGIQLQEEIQYLGF